MLRLRDFHISNFVSMEVKVHGASLSRKRLMPPRSSEVWSFSPKIGSEINLIYPPGNDHISPNSRHF